MVVILLPKWYTEAEKELEKTIFKIAQKNDIPINFVEDSKSIEDSKQTILDSLVRIDESVNVEDRKKLKEFAKDMEKCNRQNKNSESEIPPMEA